MRTTSGPGIEFLEYLTPRDGRPRPADIHAERHRSLETMIVTTMSILWRRNCATRTFVSFRPELLQCQKDKAGFSKAALVSDPDGHDVLLIQK